LTAVSTDKIPLNTPPNGNNFKLCTFCYCLFLLHRCVLCITSFCCILVDVCYDTSFCCIDVCYDTSFCCIDVCLMIL
jgi:hypothetical protein